ncbi:Uncharacterised protein [uncultured archaeon]|nr:Uncharacterised protein [uncultured archaeon]
MLKRKINFIDLGAGSRFERAAAIAGRKHLTKGRVIEAIDILAPSMQVPQGMRYSKMDVVERLREFRSEGIEAKVINADNFFTEHMLAQNYAKHLEGKERCDASITKPIQPELLKEIKRTLCRNGRLYSTTVKWHCIPLAEKLKEAGFEVRFTPITEEEAKKGPQTTRGYYKLWKNGEFHRWFGREGWSLQRIVAIKRR